VWHQRLVLGVVGLSGGKLHMIATPEWHVYAEDYGPGSADVAAVRWAPAFNVLPDGTRPVADFTAAAAVAEAAVEAGALAAAQWVAASAAAAGCLLPVAQHAVVALPAGGAAAAAASAPLQAAGVAPAAAAPPLRAPPPVGPLQGVGVAAGPEERAPRGVAAETFGQYRLGDVVQHVARAGAVCNKDIHLLPDGSGLFVVYLRPSDEEAFFDGIVAAGCRTAAWSFVHISAEGGSLDGHHDGFRSLCRLEPNGWGVAEHIHLAGAVKAALLVD
ncbi:unnamed protein product, partial [Prorocentrum cordatum]